MKKKYTILSALLIVLMAFAATALKAQATNYSAHANCIYGFTKYVNWPDEKRIDDFVIGVVGDSPFIEKMIKIASLKMVGNQKIVIKKFSSLETKYDCHILFINECENERIKQINDFTRGKSILIVTEFDDHAPEGSCINFLLSDNNKIKLEINTANLEKRNLKVASELLGFANIVD